MVMQMRVPLQPVFHKARYILPARLSAYPVAPIGKHFIIADAMLITVDIGIALV
jgi:hypothetical protein